MTFASSNLSLVSDSIGGGAVRIHSLQADQDLASVFLPGYVEDAAKWGVQASDFFLIAGADGGLALAKLEYVDDDGDGTLVNADSSGEVNPEMFLARSLASGSDTHDSRLSLAAAVNFASLTGMAVNGGGRTYGVTATGSAGVELPDNAKLHNITLKYLNFATGSATPMILATSRTDFALEKVKVDRNGQASDGSVNRFTVRFEGCSDFKINGLEVVGSGKGTAVLFNHCSGLNTVIADIYVHDMQWYNATDPGSEQMVGVRFANCSYLTAIEVRAEGLQGSYASVALAPYQTDGIDVTNTLYMTFISPRCRVVWEGMDCSGSGSNFGLKIIGGLMISIYAFGYKFTNGYRDVVLSDCIAVDCGVAGFVFTGNASYYLAAEEGGGIISGNVVLGNCHAINSGSTVVAGSHWAGSSKAGYSFSNYDVSDANRAVQHVRLNNCSAVDYQTVPTMQYSLVIENLPSEACRPQLDNNWYAAGYTVSEFVKDTHNFLPTIGGALPSVVWAPATFTVNGNTAATIDTQIAVPDSVQGDRVEINLSHCGEGHQQGLQFVAYVTTDGIVKATASNFSLGGNVTLSNPVFQVRVFKALH